MMKEVDRFEIGTLTMDSYKLGLLPGNHKKARTKMQCTEEWAGHIEFQLLL